VGVFLNLFTPPIYWKSMYSKGNVANYQNQTPLLLKNNVFFEKLNWFTPLLNPPDKLLTIAFV